MASRLSEIDRQCHRDRAAILSVFRSGDELSKGLAPDQNSGELVDIDALRHINQEAAESLDVTQLNGLRTRGVKPVFVIDEIPSADTACNPDRGPMRLHG